MRVSRSFPFVSKTLKVNFIAIATRVMLGLQEEPIKDVEDVPHVGVKVWSLFIGHRGDVFIRSRNSLSPDWLELTSSLVLRWRQQEKWLVSEKIATRHT